MFVVALALALLGPPAAPPADIDLPAELDLCILQALHCAWGGPEQGSSAAPQCVQPDLPGCVTAYEDCSYEIPEAHAPACRIAYVWGEIEASYTVDKAWAAYHDQVTAQCGGFTP